MDIRDEDAERRWADKAINVPDYFAMTASEPTEMADGQTRSVGRKVGMSDS